MNYMSSLFFIQVINIINAAQESSPMPVAEALDRVLEILRTTELYSPQLGTKDEDPHTNDLVGGLMTVSKHICRSTRVHREVQNSFLPPQMNQLPYDNTSHSVPWR